MTDMFNPLLDNGAGPSHSTKAMEIIENLFTSTASTSKAAKRLEASISSLPHTSNVELAFNYWNDLRDVASEMISMGHPFMAEMGIGHHSLELTNGYFPGVELASADYSAPPPDGFVVMQASLEIYEAFRYAWREGFTSTDPYVNTFFHALRRCGLVNPVPMQHPFSRNYVLHYIPRANTSPGEIIRLLSKSARLSGYTFAARAYQQSFPIRSDWYEGNRLLREYAKYFGYQNRTLLAKGILPIDHLDVNSYNQSRKFHAGLLLWRLPFFPLAVFSKGYSYTNLLKTHSMIEDPFQQKGAILNASTRFGAEKDHRND